MPYRSFCRFDRELPGQDTRDRLSNPFPRIPEAFCRDLCRLLLVFSRRGFSRTSLGDALCVRLLLLLDGREGLDELLVERVADAEWERGVLEGLGLDE